MTSSAGCPDGSNPAGTCYNNRCGTGYSCQPQNNMCCQNQQLSNQSWRFFLKNCKLFWFSVNLINKFFKNCVPMGHHLWVNATIANVLWAIRVNRTCVVKFQVNLSFLWYLTLETHNFSARCPDSTLAYGYCNSATPCPVGTTCTRENLCCSITSRKSEIFPLFVKFLTVLLKKYLFSQNFVRIILSQLACVWMDFVAVVSSVWEICAAMVQQQHPVFHISNFLNIILSFFEKILFWITL